MGWVTNALAALSTGLALAAASAAPAADIEGRWVFARMRYRGEILTPPNPNLRIEFEFHGDGTDRLFWSRADEPGFCERKALYRLEPGKFTELIVWVNPANASDCARDPDMRLGRETENIYRIRDGALEIDGNLGNETLTYIWDREPEVLSRANPGS